MSASSSMSRRRWPLVAVVAVLAIALVVVTTAFFARRDPGTAAPGPTTSPDQTATPRTSPTGKVQGGTTQLADGCLGGTNPSTAILAAHEKAPLTPTGAAAFTATYKRWVGQIPHARDDAATVGPKVWAPELPAYLTRIADLPTEPVSRVRIDDAKYRIDKVTKNTVSVSMVTQTESTSDGETTTQWGVGQMKLRVVDGHWRLAGGEPLPLDELAELRSEGLPFKGGC